MDNKTKKKVTAGVAAGLAATMLLAGTFAWVQLNDERINRMKTSAITDGTVHLNEEFTPKDDWEIGTEHDKKVSVTNAGNSRVFVRVSYEEVLKFYGNDGEPVAKQTGATSAADLPVAFNAGKYTGNGWVDVPSSQITPALPANVKVKAKGTKTSEITGDGSTVEKVGLEYAIFNEYEAGKFQKMDASLKVASSTGATADTWTYTVADINYYVYQSQEFKAVDWAGSNTVLGTSGTRYNVDYDYTAFANTPTTLATGTQIPTVDPVDNTRWLADLQSDSGLDSSLYTVYNAAGMTNAVPASGGENKWLYNDKDGYFYYMNVLNSGETTPEFLNALGLKADASKKYSDMQLDLVLNMEAIQAVKAAITDPSGNNGGWGMNSTDPVAVHLQSLVTK